MPLRRTSLRARLVVLVGAAFAVVGTTTLVTLLTLHQQEELHDRHQALDEARSASIAVLGVLADEGTAVRRYVLTAEPEALEPWERGQAAEPAALAALRDAVVEEPELEARVEDLVAAIEAWQLDVARPAIALAQAGRIDAAQRLVGSATAAFDELRTESVGLTEAIGDGIRRVDREDEAGRRRSVVALVVGMVVTIAGLAAVAVALHRWLTRPVQRLAQDVNRAVGDETGEIRPTGPPELAALANDVELMRRRIVRESDRDMRARLVLAQEEERRRIAAGIHDDPLQAIGALSLRLQRLRRRLDDPELLAQVRAIEDATALAAERLRHLLFELHPPTLERDGLGAALRLLCAEVFADTGTTCEVLDAVSKPLSEATSVLGYRCAREAVLNAHAHADAAHVEVRLHHRGEALVIEVEDDGAGFEPHVPIHRAGHLGLSHVQDMVRSAGGRVRVQSIVGRGTSVLLEIPPLDAVGPAPTGAA